MRCAKPLRVAQISHNRVMASLPRWIVGSLLASASHLMHFATQATVVTGPPTVPKHLSDGPAAVAAEDQGSFDSEGPSAEGTPNPAFLSVTGPHRRLSTVGHTGGATTVTFTRPTADGRVVTETLPWRTAEVRLLHEEVLQAVERFDANGRSRWSSRLSLRPLPISWRV